MIRYHRSRNSKQCCSRITKSYMNMTFEALYERSPALAEMACSVEHRSVGKGPKGLANHSNSECTLGCNCRLRNLSPPARRVDGTPAPEPPLSLGSPLVGRSDACCPLACLALA
jgi:hypothetical protein